MSAVVSRVSGLCGILFAIFLIVAFFIADLPGGDYSEGDIADFLSADNEGPTIAAGALMMLACAALVALFAGLRERAEIAHPGSFGGLVMWGSGLIAAAAIGLGGIAWSVVPISLRLSDAPAVDPEVTYLFVELGACLMLIGGGMMFAFALAGILGVGRGAFPQWFVIASAVGVVAGLGSWFFLPFFYLLLWSIMAGALLLADTVSASGTATETPRTKTLA